MLGDFIDSGLGEARPDRSKEDVMAEVKSAIKELMKQFPTVQVVAAPPEPMGIASVVSNITQEQLDDVRKKWNSAWEIKRVHDYGVFWPPRSVVLVDLGAKPLDQEMFDKVARQSAPRCECGVAKVGGIHSSWCPVAS